MKVIVETLLGEIEILGRMMILKKPWNDRARWHLAVWVLVLLAAASLGGCTWWDKTVVKPVKGLTSRRLTITSDPPGANVFVDNVFQGKTPVALNYEVGIRDLFKGFVIVVQKDGYLPVRREVSLDSKSVTFRLIRSRRRRGR